MPITKELIEEAILNFCQEFVGSPYLCYTEHGLHALFFSRLMDKVPEHERYASLYGERICLVQKEYPTHTDLGKGRRQHWDIAIIDPSGVANGTPELDHLPLMAAVEFGMNEPREHLVEDIRRLSEDTNSRHKYIVHLYRFSQGTSGRDWRPNCTRAMSPDEVVEACAEGPLPQAVTVLYGVSDRANGTSALYQIDSSGKRRIASY